MAASNNGNWQTASRWRELLAKRFDVRIAQHWPDASAQDDVAMLALHARRSADSVQAWAQARGGHGLAVVLTGTDLYQDLAVDPLARRSIELAQRLVVLQELGGQAVPPALRGKVRVIYQSTPSQAAAAKDDSTLQAVMVGHLREVKGPRTLFAAVQLLGDRGDIRIDHIGEALDPALGELATATQRECAGYHWLGALPHDETRERIRQAHVLVHASTVEGGAHVVMEAVCSATPVLASHIPGNVGMLGADYGGYFAQADAAGLADLLLRCRQGQQTPTGALLPRLGAQCALRAPMFDPQSERAALLRLVADLMDPSP